ncbi:MAG: hypothetical protein HKO86_02890 [Gammaproteobacteria bacterium]|nr:hypothetical protein [Gammaproteobacteria bacterium]
MRKIIFALAFGALLLPDYGFTLGLGEIEVNTALNQELNAEIELLSAAPEDVESLIVKLASREEFIRAGIDRPYLLNSLRFSAEVRDGVPLIIVTSDKPIREPFLNFLVEIDWPKGHMMREYTILLDPPIFMQQAPVQQQELGRPAAMESSRPAVGGTVPPHSDSGPRPALMGTTVSVAAAAAPVTESEPMPTQPVTQVQTTPAQTAPIYRRSYQPPSGYRIQQGDTLWSLADSMRPDQSVSIEQTMLAMLRSNPEAFINENVNGLKRGYILRIPDRDDIIAINQAEAVALVREQNALWREYQQAMMDAEPVSAIEGESDAGEGISVDEGGDARLEIVAVGSGISAAGSKDPTEMTSSELRAQLAIARESIETERVEKEELQQRVQSLEGQVDRMKTLLTLEDTDLAEMQQAVTPAEAEVLPEAGLAEEALVDDQLEQLVEEEMADEVDALEEMAAADELTEEEMLTEIDADEQVFVDEEQLEVLEEAVEETAASAEDFQVAPVTEPEFMQPRQQGPIAALLNNPLMLAAAGGGLLLILLMLALIMKRRKAGADEESVFAGDLDEFTEEAGDSAIGGEVDELVESETGGLETVADVVEEAPAMAAEDDASTEEEIVDTPQEAVAEENEPRDDVIAEADVYLAYGIYQQAEELLQNALKDHPDNDSYRVKLAETYSAGKNTDAFIELATEMHQRSGGENSAAWQKIAAIGSQLVPGHDLFAGDHGDTQSSDETASATADAGEAESGSEPEQEELAPDLDLGFDEQKSGDDESASATKEEVSLESVDSVEFDLNETGADITPEPVEEGVEFDLTETQVLDPEENEEEFSLDIEASELGIEDEAETAESAPDEFDLDLGSEGEDILAGNDESDGAELSLNDIDESSLEFDVDEAEIKAEPAEEEAEILDFSDQLEQETETAKAETTSTSTAGAMDDDLDLSDLDDIDEVSTKLDLAKAYLDMGDADGTRSILDEVMSEGNDEQKREADDLLRQLG